MPIYEYRCTSCHHTVEVIQKFSDAPLLICPQCSGKLEKLVSRGSFQLKGGGWFTSAYSPSKAAGPETDKEKKGEAKLKESGDTKPKEGGEAKAKDTSSSAVTSGDSD